MLLDTKAILTPLSLFCFFPLWYSFLFLNKLDVILFVHVIKDGATSTFLPSRTSLGLQWRYGCCELIFGPSYRCIQCDTFTYPHHKSCAELPLGLYHPLHSIHPLILYNERTYQYEEYDKYKEYGKYEEYRKCELCKETHDEYTYRCYYCNFNLHVRCAILQLKAKFHDHPLTPIGKSIMFTCDICGKEGKGIPNLCAPCSLWIRRSCAFYPQRIKVIRHKHQLHLTHSSLEFHQTKSRFCQLFAQKVDTLWALLLLQMQFCCPSWLFFGHEKPGIHKFFGTWRWRWRFRARWISWLNNLQSQKIHWKKGWNSNTHRNCTL